MCHFNIVTTSVALNLESSHSQFSWYAQKISHNQPHIMLNGRKIRNETTPAISQLHSNDGELNDQKG